MLQLCRCLRNVWQNEDKDSIDMMKSISIKRSMYIALEGLFENHGRCLVCFVLMFTATAQATVASIPYVLITGWLSMAKIKTVVNCLGCVMWILAFYLTFQFWLVIVLEYPKLGNMPWDDVSTEYQEWLGLTMEDRYMLILDVIALYICGAWYEAPLYSIACKALTDAAGTGLSPQWMESNKKLG